MVLMGVRESPIGACWKLGVAVVYLLKCRLCELCVGAVVYAEWAFGESELTLTLYPLFLVVQFSGPIAGRTSSIHCPQRVGALPTHL